MKELPRYGVISEYESEMKKIYGRMLNSAIRDVLSQIEEWSLKPTSQPDQDGTFTKSDRGIIGNHREASPDIFGESGGGRFSDSQGQGDSFSVGYRVEENASKE